MGNSNPANKRCGDTTSLRFFGDTSSSTTADPSTLLFTPANGTQAYRIGGADGSGLQGGPTRRLLMYAANSIELRGGLNTVTPPSFLAASAADPGVRIVNIDASRAVLRLIGAPSQAGDYFQVRDSTAAVVAVMDSGGHLGLAGKTNPGNAWIYIGAGTGSVVDNSPMGVKVKLDTTAGTRPDGIQSNINIVTGAGSGSVRSILSRVDVNDQASTGDTVALWGDVIISANNTSRDTWGLNSFVQIGSSSSPGSITYSQGAVGAEIQVANFAGNGNVGGAVHLASVGTEKIRFALKLNSGGNPMSSGLDGTNNIEHFILAADDTLAGGRAGRGPLTNFIYYGPLNADNTPTGTAKFKVDKTGRVDGVGIYDSAIRVVRSFTPGTGISGSITDGVLTVSATGGTGTVTSVSGTTNQVCVATGTTTPVLSICPAFSWSGTSYDISSSTSYQASTVNGPKLGQTGTTENNAFILWTNGAGKTASANVYDTVVQLTATDGVNTGVFQVTSTFAQVSVPISSNYFVSTDTGAKVVQSFVAGSGISGSITDGVLTVAATGGISVTLSLIHI